MPKTKDQIAHRERLQRISDRWDDVVAFIEGDQE